MTARDGSLIPRITTERLLLREPRGADFEAYALERENPNASKYLPGTHDRRQSWRLFCALGGQWFITNAGWWMVEVRETGEAVGMVGAFFRETTLHLGSHAPMEVGWQIYEKYWRRGYAKEASKAALAHGFEHHPSPRAIAHIASENVASIAVAQALGMTHDGSVDLYGEPCDLYVLPRRSS